MSTCRVRSCLGGGNGFSKRDWKDFGNDRGRGVPRLFPPRVVVEVKAIACALPREHGLPYSRLSCADIARHAENRGVIASISRTTVWRWLNADAIRPWCHRSWLWPRDPEFAEKAGRVIDLYHGLWEERPLGDDEYVLCADEKTSIQARKRKAPSTAASPGKRRKYEFEYERKGALAYHAAWDVRQAKVFGFCHEKTGIKPFQQLVDLVMSQEPYRSAKRVFWIVDNGSSHRGQASIERMKSRHPTATLVHTPVHASWLNQVEIYFSVLQRKVLTPNDFSDLEELRATIMAFQAHYAEVATPFEWKYTRENLAELLSKLDRQDSTTKTAA